jgi:hypothetical protein
LTTQRQVLLQEIGLFRHALRDHMLIARHQAGNARHNASLALRTVSIAPAALSFFAGMLRGHRSRGHGLFSFRGLISRALTFYALWRILRR